VLPRLRSGGRAPAPPGSRAPTTPSSPSTPPRWSARRCRPRPAASTAPRSGCLRARIRWLRAVEAHLSPRDRRIALIPYYAGARISEVVRLDVDDVELSARKGRLRLYGKGGKFREVDIHPKPQLRLDERPNWPHAGDDRALFLNAKGGRLTTRAVGGIIATIAQTAGPGDLTTAHVLRHTLATTLVRGKTGLVLVAEILGHARLETIRRYSLPSDKDKEEALNLITIDRSSRFCRETALKIHSRAVLPASQDRWDHKLRVPRAAPAAAR
jgi:integrase/recombinase XerC